jgi:HlyD family secretion protein
MKRAAVLIAAIGLAAAAIWWGLRPKPVAVTVVPVERGTVEATVSNTRAGTVNACRRANLSPAVGGQIESLPIDKGEAVQKGQLLLELWNEDLKAQITLDQRSARAAASQAREACVTADVAEGEAVRQKKLHQQKLASEEAADQAAGKAESTAAACSAAKDMASVSDAKIDVTRAQLQKTQLRAPFSGVVAEINGHVGEFVTPSPVGIPTPPTVDLIDTSCIYISAPIDEVDAPRISANMPARITLDAFPNRSFPGHVRRIAPYVQEREKQARTVEIEAAIDDAQNAKLLPGYSADVEVVLQRHENVLRVPTSVVTTDGFVYVFDPASGRLHKRSIKTGLSNFQYTEVLSGLSEGDEVVNSIDRAGIADGARAAVE